MSENSWEQLVTLVIPTVHHRAHLFAECLAYLELAGFKCPIIVSDHSTAESHGIIEEIIRKHPNLTIKLIYHDPDLHFLLRLADCAERSGTPYFLLHADDDFACKAGVDRAVSFMNQHLDYAACLGDTLRIIEGNEEVQLKRVLQYHKADEELRRRVFTQLMCYSSVLYALRRTTEVIATFRETVLHCPDVVFWQYLETMLCTASGKIEVMNYPWILRGTHREKWSATLYAGPLRSVEAFPYIISHSDFPGKFSAFIRVVNALVGIEGHFDLSEDTLPEAESRFVNKFCCAYAEFLIGRCYTDRVGRFFLENAPSYLSKLGSLYQNCLDIQKYAYVLSLVMAAKTGNLATRRVQFGATDDPNSAFARVS